MAQPYIDLLRSAELHPLRSGGGVIANRQVLVTGLPLTVSGGPLGTSDITIGIQVSPASASVVGIGRVITCTAPLLIDGVAAADLSANRTLSVAVFSGTTPGVVPAGASNPALFLSQTGWAAGTIVGASSVTGTAPIVVSPTTGAVVVSVNVGGILVGGIAPATGGADPTKFLCATNPISWAVPGTTGFVTLQGSSPGTAQTGHAHLSGKMLAQGGFVKGTTTNVLSGYIGTNPAFYAVGGPFTNPTVVLAQYSNDATGPGIYTYKARGITETAPSWALANDTLFAIGPSMYLSTGDWAGTENFAVRADIIGLATFSSIVDLKANNAGAVGVSRLSSTGLLVTQVQPVDTDRAGSTLDVRGSFGATTVRKTSATPITLGNNDFSYLIDGTSTGSQNITLPTAVGKQGRRYRLQKVDGSDTVMTILTTGGQLISGVPSGYLVLRGRGDYVEVSSDGSNWWIEAHHLEGVRSHLTSGSINTVVNTVSEGFFQELRCWNILWPGSILKLRGNGQFGATGAPTLRLRLKDVAFTVIADSGLITMPDTGGFSSWVWNFDCELIFNSIAYGGGSGTQWLKCLLRIQQTTAPDTYNTYEWGLIVPPAIGNGDQTFVISAQWGTADPLNTISAFSNALSLEMGCLPL